MNSSLLTTLLTTAAIITLQGCASTNNHPLKARQMTAAAIPAANPALDHYIAWVPRDKAQTATVAQAVTHISLGNAREQTAEQLCAGAGLMQGAVADIIGPVPATAPAAVGGYPAWYYRISQHPGLLGCPATHTQKLYQTLQTHLPTWLNIQTAEVQKLSTVSLLQ